MAHFNFIRTSSSMDRLMMASIHRRWAAKGLRDSVDETIAQQEQEHELESESCSPRSELVSSTMNRNNAFHEYISRYQPETNRVIPASERSSFGIYQCCTPKNINSNNRTWIVQIFMPGIILRTQTLQRFHMPHNIF
ncbi:hypothetical protein K435DRAFT_855604 [Dendrothele bispora CBS 962.96]|uniref:Uncharacterized protein n=1 Tax=Dendrothele bispora (strain CBS 962.96) TaxID=1314807 RepID=A0A4S8MC16_DENBC|nr:hypothetical protein K435DRAFT_855604 [Dendrothele bispora CBS 962.96]